jgi:hypothetical protein
MDPYLEARSLWKGIHTQLIGELSTHLLPPLLAPAYFVDVEPSLQVRQEATIYPDLQVTATRRLREIRAAGWELPVAAATASIQSFSGDEEEDESALAIRSADDGKLVTVIEILSYSNKTTGHEKRARYLLKRREIVRSGVHLMEVDLLRWGQRVVASLPPQPYHILVTRADEQPEGRVWSFGWDASIPAAPLPLAAPGEHVPLPLQAALATIYRARGFRTRLDYRADPEPPFTADQRSSVHALLANQGLRF